MTGETLLLQPGNKSVTALQTSQETRDSIEKMEREDEDFRGQECRSVWKRKNSDRQEKNRYD
ncbi:MAG: hypothetical protein OQK66_07935, partial [Prosthecochloris sp.]|nr:hypothetical protein [Prosthecochloris sp.]